MTPPKRPQPIEPSAAEVERLVAQQLANPPAWWNKSGPKPRREPAAGKRAVKLASVRRGKRKVT